jgi:hypothetical protein
MKRRRLKSKMELTKSIISRSDAGLLPYGKRDTVARFDGNKPANFRAIRQFP